MAMGTGVAATMAMGTGVAAEDDEDDDDEEDAPSLTGPVTADESAVVTRADRGLATIASGFATARTGPRIMTFDKESPQGITSCWVMVATRLVCQ